ncbi:uncharacterized protein BO96DRAFT_457488 [Aspergillus niger CBS 101883]|uniref:uncharacterized protein n=1 Tax=Aspergillus lacticoffeatus (strain CBS 101883) TaxID=1450533 RepID=UPI000D7FD44E|nr:uncharacterized protein BO96DRAFT_457488 [Aspergillus niger CBS 101883]PYH55707.1 hypothetical protein BO96DRAFT_457488 [Aspergillus niger CBS 101883]
MGRLIAQALAVLVSLAHLNVALTVQPEAAASVSVVTWTSTYADTVTSTITSTSALTTTATTCAAKTYADPFCTSDGAWSLAGNWFQQWCSGVSLEGGTTISSANYASLYACELLCYQSQTVCNGVNYNTANHACYLLTGSLTATSAASYRAAMRFTTNPCTVTETSISTGVSTETSTVLSVATYTSIITILDTSFTQTSSASTVPSATFPVSVSNSAPAMSGTRAISLGTTTPSSTSTSTLEIPSSSVSVSASVADSSSSITTGKPSMLNQPSAAANSSSAIRPSSSHSPSSGNGFTYTPSSMPAVSTTSRSIVASSSASSLLHSSSSVPIQPSSQYTVSSSSTHTLPSPKSSEISQSSTSVSYKPSSPKNSIIPTISQSAINTNRSNLSDSSPASAGLPTTSTLLTTQIRTVTSCPGSVTDCPARGKTTFLTTEIITVGTTICHVTAAMASPTILQPAHDVHTETLTVYVTNIVTISSCGFGDY